MGVGQTQHGHFKSVSRVLPSTYTLGVLGYLPEYSGYSGYPELTLWNRSPVLGTNYLELELSSMVEENHARLCGTGVGQTQYGHFKSALVGCIQACTFWGYPGTYPSTAGGTVGTPCQAKTSALYYTTLLSVVGNI